MKHHAPTYRLVILRPTGAGFASEGGIPDSREMVIRAANEWRLDVRSSQGWTPTFRVFRDASTGPTGDVTHLFAKEL